MKIKRKLYRDAYTHYKASNPHSLRFPRVVHIENTNICPARCIMCPQDKMTRPAGIMGMELFNKLINECARYPEVNELHLHGFGEPLVDKGLPAKISLAKKLGIRYTYIVSNGFLLSESMAREIISSGLDCIKFSFYGMTPGTYEKNHRNLSFSKTSSNIKRFFSLRNEMKSMTPKTVMQFARNLAPEEEYDAFLSCWRPMMDAGRGDKFYTTGLHNWVEGKSYHKVCIPQEKRHCTWPFKDIQILWDGRVIPCVYDYDGQMLLGDINSQTISEVWTSPGYKEFRTLWQRKKTDKVHICSVCDEPEGSFHPRAIDLQLQPCSVTAVPVLQQLSSSIRNNLDEVFRLLEMRRQNRQP